MFIEKVVNLMQQNSLYPRFVQTWCRLFEIDLQTNLERKYFTL